MVIYLTKDSKGLEGRAYRQLLHYYYLYANTDGTWCALFNTKGYKKATLHIDKVLNRYHRTIKRLLKDRYGNKKLSYSEPKLIGSNKLYDVQCKRYQEYLIKITYK